MTIEPAPATEPGARRSPSRSEQGAVVIWSMGLILLLFFAGGLALDLWRVLSQHGTLTGIADKAAIAAANELDKDALWNRPGLDPKWLKLDPKAEQTAVKFAQAQPDWKEDGTMTVKATVVNDYPNPSEVWVEVSGEVQLTLLRLFAPPQGITVTVNSRASPCLDRIAPRASSDSDCESNEEEFRL